jgi:hypothetical protein
MGPREIFFLAVIRVTTRNHATTVRVKYAAAMDSPVAPATL